MYRVVVDGAGSERHPLPEIEGCIKAVQEREDLEIFLVISKKDRDKVPSGIPSRIEIIEAEQKVSFMDKPSHALVSKKNSTLSIGMQIMANNEADIFISAGNTGAVMAFALKYLGRLKGVKRPSICALFPSLKGFVAVLDVGANVDSKPLYLLQFGVMGYFFTKHILNKQQPTIALLSIGEEEIKGNELVLKTKELFEQNNIPGFVGFVEGKDILKGYADVVVMDGFVGNSLLKFAEGIIEVTFRLLREEIDKSLRGKIGAFLLKDSLKSLLKRFDYESFGGAPLLGVKGNVIICHGRSSSKAIKNAIFEGIKFRKENLNQKIEESIANLKD